MYKAKSEAMKRGAQKRDRTPLTAEDLKKFKKTKISRQELRHFSFGAVTSELLLAELAPVVRAYSVAGFGSPKDVARLLNKNGWKTACGDTWSPQLVWFLLHDLYERRKKKIAEGRVAKPKAPTMVTYASSDVPLTREEMVRRLQALGRVKG